MVGSEQSDYTVKYSGTDPVDYTRYFYDVSGTNTRADSTTINKKMTASVTSKGSAATSLTLDATTKSITYYVNGTGEEQSDYTVKYAGVTPVDYTRYFYDTGVKASSDTVNKRMYASQTDTGAAVATLSAVASTKSITYYENIVGNEQSNYTVKYAGTTAVDRTYYFYSGNRASTSTTNVAMTSSQT